MTTDPQDDVDLVLVRRDELMLHIDKLEDENTRLRSMLIEALNIAEGLAGPHPHKCDCSARLEVIRKQVEP